VNVELWIEAVVAALLAVTVGYCFVLNRRLRDLRGSQGEMRQLIEEFTVAMRDAEAGLNELRISGQAITRDLSEQLAKGRALHDELKIMTESGNVLADRIERGLVGRGSGARSASGFERMGDDERSESERELIEALRQSR
jgi:Tfp pilus assembly protein PilO